MLRLRANLKGTEHNEDPDSPRSPQRHPLLLLFTQCSQHNLLVTTATLTTGLLQSITTLSTHTPRWQAGAPAHIYASTVCARTLPYVPAHSYCHTNACERACLGASALKNPHARSPHNRGQSYRCFHDVYLPNGFSLFIVSSIASFSECWNLSPKESVWVSCKKAKPWKEIVPKEIVDFRFFFVMCGLFGCCRVTQGKSVSAWEQQPFFFWRF